MKKSNILLLTILGIMGFTGVSCSGNSSNNQDSNYVSPYEDPEYEPNHSDSLVTQTTEGGEIAFQKKSFDFGTIKEGEDILHKYTFTNTGNQPVIIGKVVTSCGCTSSNFSSKPVLPGEEGFIEVEFKSDGQVGNQQKTITVQANTKEAIYLLKLSGKVEK